MRFTDNAELTTANMANADILAGTDVSADTDKKFTLEGLAKWIVEYYDGSSLAGNEQTLKDAIDNGGGGGGGDTPVSWFFTLAANEIATGANLNSLTSIGTYRASGSAVSSTLQNCPISDQGFVMRVMYGAVGAVVHQIIISAKGDLMYMRRISTNGGAPTPWTSLGGSGGADASALHPYSGDGSTLLTTTTDANALLHGDVHWVNNVGVPSNIPFASTYGRLIAFDVGDDLYSRQFCLTTSGLYTRRNTSKSNLTWTDWVLLSDPIASPSGASAGDFLVYNGTAWVAQTLATWQGGNY